MAGIGKTALVWTVMEAADSEAGLLLLQSDVGIELLVSDAGLPGPMNGRQVAELARWTRPEFKTLFIAGDEESALMSHVPLGPNLAVRAKPFPINAFRRAVHALVGSSGSVVG